MRGQRKAAPFAKLRFLALNRHEKSRLSVNSTLTGVRAVWHGAILEFVDEFEESLKALGIF